jgi:ribosomal protein S12 methylthiotransferase accessory factor YcaO
VSNSFRNFDLKTPRYRLSAGYPASIYEPSVFSAVDHHAVNGHGFGFDGDTHLKAIGEYLERHAAFRTIQPTHAGRLHEMAISKAEQVALERALMQTCLPGVARAELADHEFKLVEVQRLATGERCLYPTVFLSLHGFSGCRDADFLPVRDTSGTAIHPDRATALRSALLEFVERQCTTAMWVSRRCNQITALDEADLGHGKAAITCRQMTRDGSVTAYDISFLEGVSVFFAEYRSCGKDRLVNFACGCAADYDAAVAVLKAFTEVWQTSLLLPQMEFFGMHDYGSDKLKADFRAANRPDFELGVKVAPLRIGSRTGQATLAESLQAVSSNIYVYEKSFVVSGTKLWFCRIVSPDFFVHMSPGEGNNNQNSWIDLFCAPGSGRLEALPFS